MHMLLGNSLWNLVVQSDMMTKFILGGLLGVSILCWSLIFHKYMTLRVKKQQMLDLLRALRKAETLQDVVALARIHSQTYPGYLLVTQLEQAKILLQQAHQKGVLSDQEISLLEERRYQCIDDMVYSQEAHLPTLSVTASVSPLIGLFGTVWGLTNSFISISHKQSADIVAVAPGIAEALLTTIAGLLVAIPVAVAYHYLKGSVSDLEQQLYGISERVNFIIRLHLLQGKNSDELSLASQEAS